MKLLLLCLLLFTNMTFAKTINITDITNLNDFKLQVYNDKENLYNVNTINEVRFKNAANKSSVKRHKTNNLWFRLDLKNTSGKEKDLFLNYAQTHFMTQIYVYIEKNGKKTLINSYIRNNKKEEKNLTGNSLLTKITILPNESIKVFVNAKTHTHMYYDIRLNDIKNHTNYKSTANSYLVFLLGLVLAQAIYYLFLFALTPYKEYIYFSLVLFTVVVWSFYVYGGVAEYLNIYGNAGLPFNSLFYLFPIFTILFFKAIFIKDSQFKKISLALNLFIVILAIMPIQYLLSLAGLMDDFFIRSFMEESYFIQLFIFTFFVIYIFIKKVPLSGYFLLGHCINFVFFILTILFFAGLVPYNKLTVHSNLIGAVIESIFFSILLFYKIKYLHNTANERKEKIILQNNKLIAMKEVIENISHQWKQPLSQINSATLVIDMELNTNKIHSSMIDRKLSQIESMTKYMAQTIDDFKNFYETKKEITSFLFNESLNNAIQIFKDGLNQQNIKLVLDIEKNIEIYGLKNELQQAILIILNNAKEALQINKINYGEINISLSKTDKSITLRISDNAGGINSNIINKIFDPYYTTKKETKGSGLGLYIAKSIIEDSMNGKIEVENYKKGTSFRIILKEYE